MTHYSQASSFYRLLYFCEDMSNGVPSVRESQYQAKLIDRLHQKFPGCVVIKNDPNYRQGFPDLLVLFEDRWAALEVKVRGNAAVRPNQEYYINSLGVMSYASFIFPENEERVLDEIQQSFSDRG